MKKTLREADFLSTNEAAQVLGVSVRRVRQFIDGGRLEGVRKFGRDWMIPRESLEAVRIRKTGRPPVA
jgi:excisionase family DNA binding protein